MRFYTINWAGPGRSCSIDLIAAPAGRKGALVGEIAAVVKEQGGGARTELSNAPAGQARVAQIGDYLWSDQGFNHARLRRHLDALRMGHEPHHFTLRTGVPAEGGDLIGRDDALSEAQRRLSSCESLHLMAPRRYGKTSFLRRLQADLRAQGRLVVALDAENLDTMSAFAVSLAAAALRDGVEHVRTLAELRGWPALDASIAVWAGAKNQLRADLGAIPSSFLSRLFKALAEARVVLSIDEFSRFLLTSARSDRDGLARGMVAFQAARKDAGLTVAVAGSSGLRGFIASHGMKPLFSDLGELALEPLTPELASVLIEELFYGHAKAPNPAVVAALMDRIGAPVPYFLQVLVHHTLQEARPSLDLDAVDRAYRYRLLDVEGNDFFKPFRLRERGYPDAWRPPSGRILARLARSETSVPLDELREQCELHGTEFDAIFAALSEDYDIVDDADGARLRSKVLRERWALREAWLTGD